MLPTTAELASACYNVYETADGHWLALGALEPKFWKGFCERAGRPHLVPLQHAEGQESARVLKEVRQVMRSRTRDEWLSTFADADVCLTTVCTPDEAAKSAEPSGAGAAESAPALGADTDAVLEAAGFDAPARKELRERGVI
jgi:crotonobetainyl-CoA:carnitine CoA-transferase CaiB-like acyl-CoA transferase